MGFISFPYSVRLGQVRMGLCGSKSAEMREAERRDRELEGAMRGEWESQQASIKLLLLGAGESGKSTIFKQMKIIYGVGFSDEEKDNFTPVVYSNTIVSMRALVQACEDFGHETKCRDEIDQFREVVDNAPIDEEVGLLIKTLWQDPGIQEAYANRHKFQLHDSASYYFEAIDRLSAPDYRATEQDILRSRVRTSGIVEEGYLIDDVHFTIIDVGGQRNERKKWIHCFDDVTAVIFVAAISEYDQVLYEDSTQNRLVEALNLFDEICNSRWFENTAIILFLNKRDLFAEKIRTKDIRQPNPKVGEPDLFADYTGGLDYDEGVAYITDKFKERNDDPGKRQIFDKVTCATDKDNVKTVFDACKEVILRLNLEGSGFMDE